MHRDLKPDNILINDGKMLIADFGIASYNPEIFKIRAETKKGERIANRLFSAPEQERAGTEAHPTMDIYALGQILQWYVTGETHRGTYRTKISTFIENSNQFDSVIEKCLAHKPEERYQSVEEVDVALKQLEDGEAARRAYFYDDPYKYLRPFNDALAARFPRGINQVNYSDDKNTINRLISNIAERCNFKDELQFVDSEDGNSSIRFLSLQGGLWLMGNPPEYGDEINIKSVWVFYDNGFHADFVLLNLSAMPPFRLYQNTLESYEEIRRERLEENPDRYSRSLFLASEEAALVDDDFYVTRSEYDSGYAEVGKEVINLSEHQVSLRLRDLEERSLIIATTFHSVLQHENNPEILPFLVRHNGGYAITEENFYRLVRKIRTHKHYLVSASM